MISILDKRAEMLTQADTSWRELHFSILNCSERQKLANLRECLGLSVVAMVTVSASRRSWLHVWSYLHHRVLMVIFVSVFPSFFCFAFLILILKTLSHPTGS